MNESDNELRAAVGCFPALAMVRLYVKG